jgi:hypothetical protein
MKSRYYKLLEFPSGILLRVATVISKTRGNRQRTTINNLLQQCDKLQIKQLFFAHLSKEETTGPILLKLFRESRRTKNFTELQEKDRELERRHESRGRRRC